MEPGDVMHGAVEGMVPEAVLLSGRRGTQEGVASRHSPNGCRPSSSEDRRQPVGRLVHELLRQVDAPDRCRRCGRPAPIRRSSTRPGRRTWRRPGRPGRPCPPSRRPPAPGPYADEAREAGAVRRRRVALVGVVLRHRDLGQVGDGRERGTSRRERERVHVDAGSRPPPGSGTAPLDRPRSIQAEGSSLVPNIASRTWTVPVFSSHTERAPERSAGVGWSPRVRPTGRPQARR